MRRDGFEAERCVVSNHGLLPESLRNLQIMVISGEGGVWSAGRVGVRDGRKG